MNQRPSGYECDGAGNPLAGRCPRLMFWSRRLSRAASKDVRIVGLYGLMVMVNVALTPLSSESDTCMAKV